MKDIFNYLKRLSQNNNREWFKENKEEYDTLRVVFEFLVQQLIDELSKFDTSLLGVSAKSCIFRIYRDIRFSYDKTPYKPYFSAWITRNGRKGEYPGYYIHIEPGNVHLAAGVWHPDPKLLKMIRAEIYENYDEFKKIVQNKKFIDLFGEIRGDMLKSTPKGYDKDFEGAKYLKYKDYFIEHPVNDLFFNKETWIADSVQILGQTKQFNNFLTEVVDDFMDSNNDNYTHRGTF